MKYVQSLETKEHVHRMTSYATGRSILPCIFFVFENHKKRDISSKKRESDVNGNTRYFPPKSGPVIIKHELFLQLTSIKVQNLIEFAVKSCYIV